MVKQLIYKEVLWLIIFLYSMSGGNTPVLSWLHCFFVEMLDIAEIYYSTFVSWSIHFFLFKCQFAIGSEQVSWKQAQDFISFSFLCNCLWWFSTFPFLLLGCCHRQTACKRQKGNTCRKRVIFDPVSLSFVSIYKISICYMSLIFKDKKIKRQNRYTYF